MSERPRTPCAALPVQGLTPPRRPASAPAPRTTAATPPRRPASAPAAPTTAATPTPTRRPVSAPAAPTTAATPTRRPAPVPAAASTALAATLSAAVGVGGRVLGVFPSAVYVERDRALPGEPGVVAVVARDGVRLPNALVVASAAAAGPFRQVRAGQRAWVGSGGVDLPGLAVRAARWWDPRPRLRVDRAALGATTAELETALRGHPSAVDAAALAALAAALRAGDAAAAWAVAAGLVGLGPGLTPAGDDVLAGTLATLRLLAAPAPPPMESNRHQRRFVSAAPAPAPPPVERNRHQRGFVSASAPAAPGAPEAWGELVWQALAEAVAERAASGTTALSAALLGCASRGQLAAPAAAVVRALAGHGPLGPAVAGLVRVGHSSGSDLAAGILLAAREVLRAGRAGEAAA